MPLNQFIISLIIVAILSFVFFSILIRKQRKKYKIDTEGKSTDSVLKKAFSSKEYLALYPMFIVFLIVLNLTTWENYKGNSQLLLEEYQGNLIASIEYQSVLYARLIHNEQAHEEHMLLWNSLTSLKEAIARMSFASKKVSTEDNYLIENWKSERFIDGCYLYNNTELRIKKEGQKTPRFKFWFSPGILKEDESSLCRVKFFVKSLNEDGVWNVLDYDSNSIFAITERSKKIDEVEARLKLKRDDFNKDGYATIKMIIIHKQDIPYSLFYMPTFRFTKGIKKFEWTSYFKDALEEYDIGYYNTSKRTIKWKKNSKSKNISVDKLDSLKWIPDGQEIKNAWSYKLQFKNSSLGTILFKYRQRWERWNP